MHIAIDARIINSSTGRYVERLLHYLQKIDTQNTYTILVPSKDLTFFTPTSPNFTVTAADFANYSFSEQTAFKQFLDKLSPDLVHFCMPQQPILYKGKSVTTVHDLTLLKTYNSDKNWLAYHAKQLVGRFVFKRIAKTNKHIIVPSEFTKKEYQALTNISDDRITVTYEAADVVLGSVSPYNNPFSDFILYVGQQSDYKNIKRLGDAHQILLKKYPQLGLILVGSLNESAKHNKAYFKKNNYKNILFTGFIPDEQRDWLYQQCQAYVFPSLMEGFGLPGLEAMGYGAPVVSSNATSLPEVYGDAALYFDPLDTHDIATAIDSVIGNRQIKSDLIAKGAKKVKEYSWGRMAEQTHAIYLNALK